MQNLLTAASTGRPAQLSATRGGLVHHCAIPNAPRLGQTQPDLIPTNSTILAGSFGEEMDAIRQIRQEQENIPES